MLRRCSRALMLDGAGAPLASRIYELRLDEIHPAHYNAVNDLFMKVMPRRPEAGICLGFWDVHVGNFNQFVVIWQFKNLADRSEMLKRLHDDKEWQRSCIIPMRPFLRMQSNMLMKLIYRESNVSRFNHTYLMQFTDSKEIEIPKESSLAATFQVVVGSLEGKYVHLVKNSTPHGLIPLTPTLGNSSLIMQASRCAPIMRCIWQ